MSVGILFKVRVRPSRVSLRWPYPRELLAGLILGPALGEVTILFLFGVEDLAGRHAKTGLLLFGAVLGLGVGLILALGSCLAAEVDVERSHDPASTLAGAREGALVYATLASVGIGAMFALSFWLFADFLPAPFHDQPTAQLVVSSFITGGLLNFSVCIALSRWFQFVTARLVLALTGHLPFRVMGFLTTAAKLNLLKREGVRHKIAHESLRDLLEQTTLHIARERVPR